MNHFLLQKCERLKFSDFMILSELAHLGSIRETARVIRSTPAQVSRRLQMIEKTLGYRVFERGTKGLIVTGAGQEVLKLAQQFNGEILRVFENRRGKTRTLDRPIGIGATSFLLSHAAIPALGQVLLEIPDARSYLLAFGPDELITAGVKGAVQMAVHPSAMDWPRTWQTELIGHMRWSLFVRKGHPLIKNLSMLEEVPFVYPMVWDGSKLVVNNDSCPLPVNKRNSFIGTQTAEQAMHLVRASNVVGFLPNVLMRDSLNQKHVVELLVPHWPKIEQPVYLSLKADSISDRLYRTFSRHLRLVLHPQRLEA